ncbi:MAG: EAL domain-containing protein [Sulfuricurvum sp.]|nr:EAL domain-containing protein [Sulfuricurvum sp.]
MNNFKNAKLSTKIFITLITAGSIILLVLLLSTYFIVRHTTLSAEEQKARLLLDTVDKSVAISLFLGLTPTIDEKLASIAKLKEVTHITLINEYGTILYSYQPDTTPQSHTISVSKTLFKPNTIIPIGTLSLTYSGKTVDETMMYFYFLLGLISLISMISLLLLTSWINHLLFPIKHIANKLHNFKPGESLSFDTPYSQSEFLDIINAFDAMQQSVKNYSHTIESINQDLEQKVKEKTRELTQNLYHDTLTALPNRLKLQEDLLLFPDNTITIFNIDDFKEINDFFGIDAGDDLLNQIAYWLSEMKVQPYRIGGDEFATILPRDFSREKIQRNIESLLATFGERNFIIGDETFHLRATIGVAIMSDKPLIHADVALNKARALKKPYSLYDPSEGIEEQYKMNIAMSAQIRQALIEHRIVCQYQPIVNCKTGVIEKYETLVRIQRDDGTLIPPNDFLPIAQKTKLYSNITQEVIYQACHTFAQRTEHFSINLSSTDILDPYTLANIERILKQTGTASRVVFEILESEGIENFEEVASFITRMKELGAAIAIDDFGSGYSNFENILKLNVDFLKIDGSLIRTIDQNSRHRIVVESIVDFAHRIGIETIAEFVATEEILTIITELGITYSQGYYTGKPHFL